FRQAILTANAHPGLDRITFNIPGPGVHTIVPTSALPAITDPAIIDGYSQPGARPNALAEGDDAVLLIELSGQLIPAFNDLLTIRAGNSTVRGLVINRAPTLGSPIVLTGNGGNRVEGNFIGTDSTGAVGLGLAGSYSGGT